MSCRTYINNLTDDVEVQAKLEQIHNSVFNEIDKSKLFRKWNGLRFLPNVTSGLYSKAKALIAKINGEHGFPVAGTTFTKDTGREYAFVNVKNYVGKIKPTVSQGELFSPQRLTFLRHGVTREDLQGKNSGQNSIPLMQQGREESKKAGERLREMGVDRLYISPTKRSIETAEETEIPYEQVEGLAAWDLGEFSGKPEGALDEAYYVKNEDVKIPGGESFKEFVTRTKNALDTIAREKAGNYAIVTHSKTLQLIEALEKNNGQYNDQTKKDFLKEQSPKNDQIQMNNWYRYQSGNTLPSKASPMSLATFKEWARRAGLVGQYVDEMVINGKRLNAAGVASIAENLYKVLKGEQYSAEPEEIMHFAVQAIKETEPALYKKMLNAIGSYNIYGDVFNVYSKIASYQTKEGKPDIALIKEEAITKTLVNTIILKEEGALEKPEQMERARGWWQQIKDWFFNLIGKAGFNPFESAAERILSGETFDNEVARLHRGGVMLSVKQNTLYDKLIDQDSKLSKKTVKNEETGEEEEKYFIGDKQVKRRVTDRTHAYYDNLFKNKSITESEYQKAVDDLKRQFGTKGHHDLENIFHRLVNENGFLREVPDTQEYTSETAKDVYNTLYANMRERLMSYPKGTRFLSEVKIYDPKQDLAGTIDFLAITPDDKVDVLDWKFYDLNTAKFSDVQWYKKEAWRRQISAYTKMLQDNYEVQPSEFNKTQAIPIRTNYQYRLRTSDNKMYPVLTGVEIGNVNVGLESNDYLLPVPLVTQSTGDKKLDELVRKFAGLRERVEGREVKTFAEKFDKAEQLNKLEQVIRHLQIKQLIDPLVDQATTFNKDIEGLIAQFKDVKSEEYNEYATKLSSALEDIKIYTNLSNEVRHITKKDPELKKKVDGLVITAKELETDLWDTAKEFGEKIANEEGISGLMDPEVVVSLNKRLFKGTAKLQTKAIQSFYEIEREARNKADNQTRRENEELRELANKYEELAKANGLTRKDYFKFIMREGKDERGNNFQKLIDQYQKAFYDDLKKAIREKNVAWIKENTDVTKFKEKLAEDLQKKIDLTNAKPISDEEKNNRISNLKAEYSTEAIDSYGWFLHYGLLRDFPVEGKWESEDWKTLNAPENKAALDLYNWIKKINEKAEEAGYLPSGKVARTFLPMTPQSMLEAIQMGNKPELWDRFMRGITMDEDNVGYGAIDRVTGQIVNKIPRYFISNTDKELSIDLVKNLVLYNEHLNNYKYLSDIEGKARLLGKLERNKGSIITVHGKPKFNALENRFETIETNEKNADLYDRQLATLLYGQKYVADGRLDAMLGNAGDLAKRINKFVGAKILPEDFTDKQISLVKSVDTLNSFFQQKTLGLSILPALSNYIGGNLQLGILSGKYFTKSDVTKAELQIIGAATSGEQGKKLIAAMKLFNPFTRDKNRDLIRELSINTLSDNSIQDFLMFFMRKGDSIIEGATFASLWNNSILIDGKIYNAREYVKNSAEYKARYETPGAKLKEDERGFQSKVDDLLEKYSLAKQSKLVNGKLVIPGIAEDSEELYGLRNLTQALSSRVVGNMSPTEVRGISQNVVTNSMMVFKNWIPPLADTRFSGLQHNKDIDAWEWGRARNVMRYLATYGIKAFSNMYQAVQGTEKGIQGLNDMYEFKKKQYYESTGQKLDISKEDFYDMVRLNIRQSAKDALFVASLLTSYFLLKAIPPDDDEDPGVKNWHKFMVRALDKFSDEVSFYYSPLGWQQIIGGTIIPSIGVFKDFNNLFQHFLKEVWGMGFDENMQENNYVIKYLMKNFPVTSQLSTYLPLLLPDLAKELGIQASAQSRLF